MTKRCLLKQILRGIGLGMIGGAGFINWSGELGLGIKTEPTLGWAVLIIALVFIGAALAVFAGSIIREKT